MSLQNSPAAFAYQRLRIRFRKEGDLRWISHRDLVRVVERLCRRADLALRMSEGFHPKPKLSFPSALAVGIEGRDEVLELELVEPVEPHYLQSRLNALAPPGLAIVAVQTRSAGQRKARVESMWYEFPVPDQRRQPAAEAIADMTAATSMPIAREGRSQPVDILANLTSIELHIDRVRFCLRATGQASAHPRDILRALGLADLEQQGLFLTRSEVEVTS